MSKSQNCENCMYWDTSDSGPATPGTVQSGECHRMPPITVRGVAAELLDSWAGNSAERGEEVTRGVWPLTHCYSWCGEWRHDRVSPEQRIVDAIDDLRVEISSR